MKVTIIVGSFSLLILLFGYYLLNTHRTIDLPSTQNPHALRYVAVGDSYTIGLDVDNDESWPILLTQHLQNEGIQIELIDNIAVSGYTTDDVIRYELPVYEMINPQFATILIGANDSSLGMTVETFQKNFVTILDTMQAKLTRKDYLVVLTIPDYTNTPRGIRDFSDDKYAQSITQFNEVIKSESQKRNLTVVDLQDINEDISEDESYYTADGLHPSAKQYVLWEQRIYPKVKALLDTN